MTNKGWTQEKREAAAERARHQKPWEKSTGPTTFEGKAAVKNNALKHGTRSEAYRDLLATLKAQENYVKSLDFPTQTP